MNCDEAFELITHPTDFNCDELQWHLQMCPRCRQMQETLAPALNSFYTLPEEEDLTAEELEQFDFSQQADQRPDPGFSQGGKPFLSPEAVRIAEQAATRLEAQAGSIRPRALYSKTGQQRKRLLQAALILLAGLLMGWGISLDVPQQQFSMGPGSLPGQPQPCLWIARGDDSFLQQEKTERGKASVNSVVLSCVACHLQSSAE